MPNRTTDLPYLVPSMGARWLANNQRASDLLVRWQCIVCRSSKNGTGAPVCHRRRRRHRGRNRGQIKALGAANGRALIDQATADHVLDATLNMRHERLLGGPPIARKGTFE
jgi:hypothetical protein